jgi:hypothetical protein
MPSADLVALVEPNANGGNPAAIRPSLAQLAAANLPELQRTLLDAALNATTERWATVTCTGCGAKSRVELPVPDVKARLQAIQMLLSESLGKTPMAPEVVAPALPRTTREIEEMPWDEMCALVAFFTEESERDLHERLAALSAEERRLLRQALDASQPSVSGLPPIRPMH